MNQETRNVLALTLAAAAMVLAWVAAAWEPDGAALTAVQAALWTLGTGAVAVVLTAARRRGLWFFVDLALVGVPLAVGSSAMADPSLAPLGVAYLLPLGIGIPGSVAAVLSGRRTDRTRAAAERRTEALRQVGRIHWRLWTGSAPVTDLDIRAALSELEATLEGDAASRAALLLAAVAPVCAARPERAAELLGHVAAPLARLGFRRAETVLHWLDPTVLPGFAPAIDTDDRGRKWLEEDLAADPTPLQQALDEAHRALGPEGPAGAGLRDMIANSLQNQGRDEEALRLFEELAAEGDPLGLRRDTIAWLRARLGDPSLARDLMEDETRPELTRARFAAAVGENDRAVALLRAALAHNPAIRPEWEGGFETLYGYPPYVELFGES